MSSLSRPSLNPAKSATPGRFCMGIDDLDSNVATSRLQNILSGTDGIGANVSKFEFSRAEYKSSVKKLKGAGAHAIKQEKTNEEKEAGLHGIKHFEKFVNNNGKSCNHFMIYC